MILLTLTIVYLGIIPIIYFNSEVENNDGTENNFVKGLISFGWPLVLLIVLFLILIGMAKIKKKQ